MPVCNCSRCNSICAPGGALYQGRSSCGFAFKSAGYDHTFTERTNLFFYDILFKKKSNKPAGYHIASVLNENAIRRGVLDNSSQNGHVWLLIFKKKDREKNQEGQLWSQLSFTRCVRQRSAGLTGLNGWMRACVARYWWAARRHALKVPWDEENSGGKSTVYGSAYGNIWSIGIKAHGTKMARNTSLYFRIVEGRNLPAKDVWVLIIKTLVLLRSTLSFKFSSQCWWVLLESC